MTNAARPPGDEAGPATGLRAHLPRTLLAIYDHNFGLALIALAQFFFAAMSMSVKYLIETTDMSTVTLIFVRMGITGMCCWCTLLVQRDPHPLLGPPGIRRMLCVRGFAGFSGLLCAYQALRGLSVSDMVTIQFLTPTVTALIGYLLLGESFSFREAVAGLTSLCGVVLISRPAFLFGHHHNATPPAHPEIVAPSRVAGAPGPDATESTRLLGVSWAVAGVFFSAAAYLSIRYIGTRANALHSISYFSLACTIGSGIAILAKPGDLKWPHDTYGFVLIFIIGIFGFCAQVLLTFGLQNEKAGRAGLAMYLQIFFAVVLELLVFHTLPSFLSFIGMAVILSSAAWVALSSLKIPPADEEEPLSRSPSPLPDGKSARGELYAYEAVPQTAAAGGAEGPGPSSSSLRTPSPRP